MNKTELIAAIASESGQSKARSRRALEAMVDLVADALSRGESIAIAEFGSWYVEMRGEQAGRNPRTGESIRMARKRLVKFHQFSHLETAANRKALAKEHDQLTAAIATIAETTIEDACKLIDAFVVSVSDALFLGDNVVLIGFGAWKMERAASSQRSLKMNRVKFKPGKHLKAAANAGKRKSETSRSARRRKPEVEPKRKRRPARLRDLLTKL